LDNLPNNTFHKLFNGQPELNGGVSINNQL